jgi:galactokinase/galacturonokinase
MAIDRSILLAFIATDDGRVSIDSLDFEGRFEFGVGETPERRVGDWGDYLRGAASQLGREYALERGVVGVVAGEMPVGGLSSSAAVTLAYLVALGRANDLMLSREELVSLAHRTENEYVGVASGILDQSVIVHSEREQLTVIDCRTGEVERLPAAADAPPASILVVHSGVTRALVSTGFNDRVSECREAARRLLAAAGSSSANPNPRLCEVSRDLFDDEAAKLPRNLRLRAEHFFGEMRRVEEGIDAWCTGDLVKFGELVFESGASSIHNYECASEQLTTLYEILRTTPGVYGARFSGGGFGGSCLALVDPDAEREIAEEVRRGYTAAHPGVDGFSVHFCRSSNGLRVFEVEAR